MGLDNYPDPEPCIVLEKAGKLKIVRNERGQILCEQTNCPFNKLSHIIGIFGTYCWIRGKVYNYIVEEVTNDKYSLYDDLTKEELVEILKAIKDAYNIEDTRIEYLVERLKYERDSERSRVIELAMYLEVLTSIDEWDGKLVAWA